jgi:hypothetical protein
MKKGREKNERLEEINKKGRNKGREKKSTEE